MASAPRQPKPTRKGAPESARRTPAWTTGARGSPTYSPGNTSPRPQNGPTSNPQGAFPPLSQPNGTKPSDSPPDRILQTLSGLTGTTITLLTKTSLRFEGVVASTGGEGNTTGVTLKDVKDISNPGSPVKEQLFIASTNIETWTSGPADAKAPNGNADSFKTDTDISQKTQARRDRELQAWQPGSDTGTAGGTLGKGDDLTFGSGAAGHTAWDQFAANEQLFGVKTNFDEDVYTTKLDRSAADYKERERNAQRIANEILGATTNNPHVAEERSMVVDDTGIDEEQKYGAVVRGTNAYIPPGARKPNSISPTGGHSATPSKSDIPKVSVNGPDGADVPSAASPSPSSKVVAAGTNINKPPADPLPAFRDFVTNEKQRLTQKRQALVKSEMDKRKAELVKFSQSFKLNKPIPDDLVPILAKDEEKQKSIREKSNKDATSSQARTIGVSALNTTIARAAPLVQPSPSRLNPDANRKQAAGSAAPNKSPTPAAMSGKATPLVKFTPDSTKTAAKPAISMFIQQIPPFKGNKSARPPVSKAGSTNASPNDSVQNNVSPASTGPMGAGMPMSPGTATKHLNVNASSFRPNPKANAFNPIGPSPSSAASASVSPKPKAVESPPAANAFFGTRVIKRTPVNVKDDFNPFKHNKVAEASQVSAQWPYQGKRYIQMFPPQHSQQHSPHMQPPVPPPMPPPSYEEDSAAQAAARGYVYAYPPYGYPGQPMMPGMGPPGPPGGYLPGPFMQPMPYPPGMPPPNGQPMYAPQMGQMPPPQAYMPPPPPPGQYPPPPNGAGPRPSMPPTPIPSHAHPYYHHSPQLQHAVPYPMMMPPPAPNGPPHPYDGGPAPPVPMGGVGHA